MGSIDRRHPCYDVRSCVQRDNFTPALALYERKPLGIDCPPARLPARSSVRPPAYSIARRPSASFPPISSRAHPNTSAYQPVRPPLRPPVQPHSRPFARPPAARLLSHPFLDLAVNVADGHRLQLMHGERRCSGVDGRTVGPSDRRTRGLTPVGSAGVWLLVGRIGG